MTETIAVVSSIPDTIKIFHKVFTLKPTDFKDVALSGKLGQIDHISEEITYFPHGDTETVDTIIHEILHGIIRMMAIGQALEEGQEEYLVSALATGLTTVMTDNVDLFYSLLELVDTEDA